MYVTQKQYDSWNSLAKITEVYQIRNRSREAGFETALGNQIMALDNVTGITFYSSLQANFADMISSISIIVVVLVISAAALAAVVLYNLSNVNISERVREIATIKVLGFTDREVDRYVNRESIIMTIIGAGAGLLVGIYLHDLIMNLAEMDEVMFGRTINPISFVIAFFMTTAFSLIINGIMHFHLRGIQMVESLKAVE
jgi:putative ABC transport system permease protein